MKDERDATGGGPGRKKTAGHRIVYVAIPDDDYRTIEASAKANCRSIGRELLYQWRKANAHEGAK